MSSHADPDVGPDARCSPLCYFILSIGCAAIGGWLLASGGITTDPFRILLGCCMAAATIGTLLLYKRNSRLDNARRLAMYEDRLRQSDERLRQAQKMEAIGQLAGGIAHDFNNLVTVIGCSVGLIADVTEPNDPRQDDLGQIKEASDRAASLTRQLLAFSRRQVLQPRQLDVNDVVRDMEKMIRRVIGTHIMVHTTLDRRLGLVLADVGQMEQVIMNLAVNSRDAMSSGGALMFATCNRAVRNPETHQYGIIEPGEYVTLVVRDTGQGIPPHVMEHLFEPFFTTKDQGKGTGLGLATVHSIVSQAGGYITVDSAIGVGTTFTILFPRILGTERIHTPPSGILFPTDTSTDTQTKPHTIVVVDDEEAILEIGARVLRQAGFRVFTATQGEAAIQILRRERNTGHAIDVVLTDVVMPVMGGRELSEIIARDFPETPVLCMSGYARDELHSHALIEDELRLVHKPFEVGDLITAVRETMATR